MQCNNYINIMHNIAYDKKQCTNAFFVTSLMVNPNAINVSVFILHNIAYVMQMPLLS